MDLGTAGERGTGLCVQTVGGQVVDESGIGIRSLPVTVCGPVCFRSETDSAGQFLVPVNARIEPSRYSVSAHGGPLGSTFYVPLPTADSEQIVDVRLRVLRLDQEGSLIVDKTQADAGVAQTLGAGPLRVAVPTGTVVRLNPGDALSGEAGRTFRLRELESSQFAEFGAPSQAGRLFALAPFEARFEGDAVGLELDNTAAWAPDLEIVFFALGTYLDEDWLGSATFGEIGRGHVDGRGETIRLEPELGGAGLRFITWLWVAPLDSVVPD